MQQRHRSDASRMSSFQDEVLVACPHCARCAVVALRPLAAQARTGALRADAEGRFSCVRCGANARRIAFVRATNAPCDPVFGLPVWLQASCRHGTLWAYNARHLDEIEAFVGATLRERRPRPGLGWANQAWTSRLPQWVMLAKNRADVLECIARMREK